MENQARNQLAMFGERRAANNTAFKQKLQQMALPLAPLVQLTTGDIHPAFPGTLLNFWLLTDAQLEELAHFYHQRTPCRYTFHYPCPINWSSDMPLEEKRRKIGRFIGLRGCESPIRVRTEDEIMEDARRARLAEEDEMWKRKLRWY
ncbi:hypothetical protein ANO14919_124960 [Xylariales sp. No.14919]|nr:hypothetical protein F5X98DRAFT_338675 [Xylaria grammica]GAW22949.1 hypothetical protein ANO14919_124960 [Xylariales sp. No.14919]